MKSLLHHEKIFILLSLLVALSLGAGIGIRDPSPPDEPRFVLSAKHMVESGDWLVPHRGREFYAEKPPVFMWLQATAYTIYPNWKIAFLLPSLLAAMGVLWLTYDLARRLWGTQTAIYSAAALWVCIQFGLQAKRGQIDMVLVFMSTLSLWGLLRHLLRGPAWGPLWLGAFAAGVGTVTKGVGFLPLLVFLPWLVTRRFTAAQHSVQPVSFWRYGVVPIAFVAGCGVWLGPLAIALIADPDPALRAYAGELLFKQTSERYVNAWHHIKPVWYYVQVITTLWLPGALLLPWLASRWWQQIRAKHSDHWVLLGWCLLVLIFFSASPGKREVYIFPMLPALCIAAAPLLPELLQRRGVQWMLSAYVGIFSTAFFILGLSGFFELNPWAQSLADQRDIPATAMRSFVLWLLAAGIVGLLLLGWGRLKDSSMTVVLFTAVLWTTYGLGLTPSLDATSSAKALMMRVGVRIGPQAELGMIAWREQNLLQADRPVVDFGFKQSWQSQWDQASRWVIESPQHRWLFVLEEALSPCVNQAQVIAIGQSNRRDWVLVPGSAIVAGCKTPKLADTGEDAL